MKEFGKRVADARKAQRLSVVQAAKKAGIARDTWKKIEGGQPVHDTKRQAAIDALGMPDAGGRDGAISDGPRATSGRDVREMPREEQVFGLWDASFSDMLKYEAEYGRLRGIDRSAANDELLEVWRMWHDGLEGRPWTPPWAPQDEAFVELYGEGAKPWLREWWSRQEMTDEPWVTLRMKRVQDEIRRGGDGDVDHESGDSAPTSVPLAALDDHEDRPDDPHD